MPTPQLNWLLFQSALVSLAWVSWASATTLAQDRAPARLADARQPNTFDVKEFGAKGDGVTDDTPAIQSAINAAHRNVGGGIVHFAKGTYLLNSAYPSSHPWAFHNLIIDSNVTLLGETGAKLLQGPNGR